jgi:HD-GYP domain-containing protein (c-di-GMP phosphodiesterase class II)
MWLHTEIGAQVLRNFQLFRAGSAIVLHHHESWDGTGYPGRLAGDAIPLGARVVAVADSFDAMTSGRPYRVPLSVDEALDRLRRGAGIQWDPTIVGAFIKVILAGRVELPRSATQGKAWNRRPSLTVAPDGGPVHLDEAEREELRNLDHPTPVLAKRARAR